MPIYTTPEARLIRELLENHRTNLEGHLAAIEALPELQDVAQVGQAEAAEQLRLVDSILAQIRV